jgi:anti-sigma factor RsiW
MNITCEDSDRIFEDGTPAEWAALEAHSANCAACAEELRAWKAIRAAAKEMRDYSDSPSLWPRIEQALTAEAAGTGSRLGLASLSDGKPQWPLPWFWY